MQKSPLIYALTADESEEMKEKCKAAKFKGLLSAITPENIQVIL
jgi:hypothetical protein